MGYEESEIKEEYTIKSSEMKEGFRVDVVGIKPNHKVAVECGITNSDKLVWEKLFFDEVIVLPFFKMDKESVLLERRIRELEEKVAEQSKALEESRKEKNILVADSDSLANIYMLVKALLTCFEGKSPALLALWDYHLSEATRSLTDWLVTWKERYEEIRGEKQKNGS
jgi:uncharacterized coiled-coil protein SlyX